MCANYKTVIRTDEQAKYFGTSSDPRADFTELKPEVWPLGLAPIIRLDEKGHRRAEIAQFGLVPQWAKDRAYGRSTYNARTETVQEKPSFKDAWTRGQRCIIPADSIYEPCYETGKAVRWRIEQADEAPVGIAGIYVDHSKLKRDNGTPLLSFSMLTVNADGHPVFQCMHAPQDEKRMVVILDPNDYDDWLTLAPEEATSLFKQWTGPLNAYPKPLPPRGNTGIKTPT